MANQTVDFQLTDSTGGSLSAASAVTNAQGVAQTVYTATGTSSTYLGVTVAATVRGTALSSSLQFTVGGQSVNLSLGTGIKLAENATQTQFLLPYSVLAVDAAGNPVAGAVESTAATLPDIIAEMRASTVSEREGRIIDHDGSASMEQKKQEGYF